MKIIKATVKIFAIVFIVVLALFILPVLLIANYAVKKM